MRNPHPAAVAVILLAAAIVSVAGAPVPGVDLPPFGAQSVWPNNPDLVTILDRMQEAGIRWGRFDLCWWSICEQPVGTYDFVSPNYPGYENWNTDRAIQLMRDRGIEPFPILCYGHPNYDGGDGPYSPAGRTAFGNYCYAAASRYRNSVSYWEIWNEPNLEFFWSRTPDPEDYALLAQVAAARIRQANPDAIVAGGVTSGIDLGFLDTAFQYGLLDAVDIITVHPYRIAAPETINGEISTLRSMIASHTTRSIDVWTGEWGYDTAWTEVTPLSQAKCLGRMMVNNLSIDIGLSIWFSTHPYTEHSPTDPGWGLLDYSYGRRPSFYAMRTVNERLGAPVAVAADPIAVTLIPSVPDQRVAVFERGDDARQTIVIWMARWPLSDSYAGQTTTVRLGITDYAEISAWDGLDGDAIPVSPVRVGDRIELRGFRVHDYPVYIDVDRAGPNMLTVY